MNKSRSIILVVGSLVLCTGMLCSCGPRGESKTVAEVLAISQAAFNEQIGNAGPAKEKIVTVQRNLEVLLNDQSDRSGLSNAASEISTQLAELTRHAGYTSRPAFGELATQFRELSSDAAAGNAQANRLKLIASRAYSTMASELATTKFTVLPLNSKS